MKSFLILLVILFPFNLFAQDSSAKKNSWLFSGYLKDLEWIRFDKAFTGAAATNLLHNRINVKWSYLRNWTGRLEVRNRFYWGDDVRILPGFKQQLRNESEAVNLSINWFETKSAILHTNLERLWMDYKKTNGISAWGGNASIGALPIPGIRMIFLIVTTSSILIMKNGPAVMPSKGNI